MGIQCSESLFQLPLFNCTNVAVIITMRNAMSVWATGVICLTDIQDDLQTSGSEVAMLITQHRQKGFSGLSSFKERRVHLLLNLIWKLFVFWTLIFPFNLLLDILVKWLRILITLLLAIVWLYIFSYYVAKGILLFIVRQVHLLLQFELRAVSINRTLLFP